MAVINVQVAGGEHYNVLVAIDFEVWCYNICTSSPLWTRLRWKIDNLMVLLCLSYQWPCFVFFSAKIEDGKGFQCQGCQLVRSKEEIKEIVTEIELLSEEAASKSSFSCGIL